MQRLGVHSEVGTLRRVMVCRPGLAHQRLTPGNRAELLFDDVLWVHEAQKDHNDFVLKMKERGVEVLAVAEDVMPTSLFTPEAVVAIVTLTSLELVLGIDNVIFIAILAGKLPPHQHQPARVAGLALAALGRIVLMFAIVWIIGLTATLFTLFGAEL